MRVLLIVPNTVGFFYKPTTPHIGIAYLASNLEKNEHDVQVLDMRINDSTKNLKKIINSFDPELIGITCSSYRYKVVYDLIKKIKGFFRSKIIIGGPHVSVKRVKILEECEADFANIGEGEYTLVELCGGKDYGEIEGLIWRSEKGIIENKHSFISNLDALPFPAYDKFELNKYVDKKIPIVSSRGCPGGCTFCSVKMVMGNRFRARSSQNVVNEIEYWYKKGYRQFQFTDDCFSFDLERAKNICDEIIKRGLKIKWDIRNGIRVDRLDKELLGKMKEAGCTFIMIGIESIDPEVLKRMKKGITPNEVKEAIRLADEIGLDIGGFFIIGLPGDTFKSFKESLKFANSSTLKEVRFFTAIPYPNTELYNWVDKNATWLYTDEYYLNYMHNWSNEPVFETKEFTAEERRQAYKLGEKLVMKRLLTHEFGNTLGYVAWLIWSIPLVKKFIMKFGLIVWTFSRALKTKW